MKKKSVLIIYNKLFHYRIPIFNILGEKFNLTVAYSIGPGTDQPINFKILKLPYLKFLRFHIQKNNLNRLCKNFDVVICDGDINWLKNDLITIRPRKYKVINWSIGVSASYNKRFDADSKWNRIRYLIKKRADALVFYTDYPISKYTEAGFNREKLFVANNTVEVRKIEPTTKDSILFIGTLYYEKGVSILLSEYKRAYDRNNQIPNLNIVGDGPDFKFVESWIKENKLELKIKLLGCIYDSFEKSKIFSRAFATFSPNQAGLGVLESMGYGVPFITSSDSITGGERLNIIDNVNGLFFHDFTEISNIIINISVNPAKYTRMGEEAKKHYYKSRKPSDMARGLINAIEFVVS